MSTRKTISINRKMHLFEELADGSLYIELEDVGDCALELWTTADRTSSRVLIKISKEDFEKMINDYESREN